MTLQGFYDAYGQLSTPGSGYQAPSPMPTRPDESASASQVGQQGSQQSQPAQPTQQQMPHQQSFYNMNPYAAAAYNPYGAYYGFNQFPQQVPPNFSALQGYPYGYGASSPAAAAAPQQQAGQGQQGQGQQGQQQQGQQQRPAASPAMAAGSSASRAGYPQYASASSPYGQQPQQAQQQQQQQQAQASPYGGAYGSNAKDFDAANARFF